MWIGNKIDESIPHIVHTIVQCTSRKAFELCEAIQKETVVIIWLTGDVIQLNRIATLNTFEFELNCN